MEPQLLCAVCRRRAALPASHARGTLGGAAADAGTYICPACEDRIRAEAVERTQARGRTGA